MPMFDYVCEVCGARGRSCRKEKPQRFCSKECRMKGMAGQEFERKYIVSEEARRRIVEMYRTGTGNGEVTAMAEKLKVPRYVIRRIGRKAGVVQTRTKCPDWTEPELKTLERLARYTPEVISRRMKAKGFDRSATACSEKLKQMRFRQNLKGMTASMVADGLGVHSKTILRAVRLGKIKADRRGTAREDAVDHFWITPGAVRDYLVEYLPEIDFRKVDKFWVVDLLTGGEM